MPSTVRAITEKGAAGSAASCSSASLGNFCAEQRGSRSTDTQSRWRVTTQVRRPSGIARG
jgi:hypothetical protein